MKRKLLIALLAFGTVAGFGSGIASMACWHHRAEARRAAFERHVADVCVEAAYRARPEQVVYEPAYEPAPEPRPDHRYRGDHRPSRRHRGHPDHHRGQHDYRYPY